MLSLGPKKCLFLDDARCMVRLINPNKCTRSCKFFSPEICVPIETKDTNVTAFNMITNKKEDKTMIEHVSCDLNAKSTVQHVIRIKKGIIKYVNANVKITVSAEKTIIVGILTNVFVGIVSL